MSNQRPSQAGTTLLNDLSSILRQTIDRTTPGQRALAFGAIPLLLLAVGALPEGVQQRWMLRMSDPIGPQLYLSNFVHGDIQHLSNNILSFLLVMAIVFPLATLADRVQDVAVSSVVFLTAVPFVISLYSVTTLSGTGAETIVGFSGIVAAYAGLLPVVLFQFVDATIQRVQVPTGGAGLMAVELSVVLWAAGLQTPTVLLLGGVGALGLGLTLWRGREESRDAQQHEWFLLFVGGGMFLALPALLIVGVDAGTNVFGHLIGLICGFLLALGISMSRQLGSVAPLSDW
jgi:hypothetical protein